MKLTMLGTGHAMVTECYNTCFVLREGNRCFLVDGGGGNTILSRLKQAQIDWREIGDIFVTHRHVDHLLGIIWIMRLFLQNMNQGKFEGEVRIYAHEEVIRILNSIAHMLLPEKQTMFIGKKLHLITVEDGQKCTVIGHEVIFFDIHSTKAKQFGFTIYLEKDEKLTCCGDEPYNEYEEPYAARSKWLMHEAFCLQAQEDEFKPYEKHHSTVRDACKMAERLQIKNLVLYHTEDQNITCRRELYEEEGKQYYHGNLYIPEDLETIELD